VRKPLRRIHEGILRLLQETTILDMLNDSEPEVAGTKAPLVPLVPLEAAAGVLLS
jgi:hypothetical protein